MRDFDAFLKALVANDRSLAEEVREKAAPLTAPRGVSRSARAGKETGRPSMAVRTIVMRVGRPVLAVVDDAPELTFSDSESEVWRARLAKAGPQLQRAARAVGRIEVVGHPRQLKYVGTGWLVDTDVVLTNRHVAREFSRQDGRRFTFARQIDETPMATSIDFLEEAGKTAHLEFRIVDILHVEPDEGPDVAFLRVDRTSDGKSLAPPISLARSPAGPEQQIAVIGYPARDSRIPDDQLMHRIFGNVYDKKRLAPGQVTGATADVVRHDCSTLGGNSGSVLLDLATGDAVGLHFAGRFLESNFAVPASVVADRLERIAQLRPPAAGVPMRPPAPVPIQPQVPSVATSTVTDSHEILVEGVPEDYADRTGYDTQFLGVDVSLPVVGNTADVLTYPWNGGTERELRYEHFSVVMSRSRRLCIFSAVNIDGRTPRRLKRPSWRLDPRIPKAQQIRDECYGSEPKFSRGHMTRREDPIWGDEHAAVTGNSDSMHVTNTVPQMQPFNGGIWLSLESYALEHAREDDMRISVFTGPFLFDDDPIRHGVKIPRSFWKVVAFIHDETGKLCATGYTMSQESFLRDEEFVFGQHQTSQVRIEGIERLAGISFGALTALDPLTGDEEGVAPVLTDPSQIRFK